MINGGAWDTLNSAVLVMDQKKMPRFITTLCWPGRQEKLLLHLDPRLVAQLLATTPSINSGRACFFLFVFASTSDEFWASNKVGPTNWKIHVTKNN